MKQIILASKSPRRRQLLKQIRIPFDVVTMDVDEDYEKGLKPFEIVECLSYKKAKSVAQSITYDAIVIGADTIVAINDIVLGKPIDKQDAFNTLRSLSNTNHEVYTGITLIDIVTGKSITFYEKTEVFMRYITDSEIEEYIKTNEPMDKAGSYGIQGIGAIFVEKIVGDYNNVVGLPLQSLYSELKNFGYNFN